MREHWFWWIITVAVMVWYSTITLYVSVRGALDIKHMLARLRQKGEEAEPPRTPEPDKQI